MERVRGRDKRGGKGKDREVNKLRVGTSAACYFLGPECHALTLQITHRLHN